MTHEKRAELCESAISKLPAPLRYVNPNFNTIRDANRYVARAASIYNYDEQCFRPLNETYCLYSRSLERSLISISDNSYENSELRPICTGFFISQTEVVTAGHCFQDVSPSGVIISYIFQPEGRFRVASSQVKNSSSSSELDDIAILTVEPISQHVASPKPLTLAPELLPKSPDRDYVAIVSPRLPYLLFSDFSGYPYAMFRGLTCSATETDEADGCISHTCHTLPGASGSPLLLFSKLGGVFVVGMHIRNGFASDRKGEKVCGNSPRRNIAIKVQIEGSGL